MQIIVITMRYIPNKTIKNRSAQSTIPALTLMLIQFSSLLLTTIPWRRKHIDPFFYDVKFSGQEIKKYG